MQRITKSIWKTIRPKFSNKYKTANTIILVENNKILQDDKAIANTFINYFDDVTHSIGLKKNHLTWKNSFKNCRKFQKLWVSARLRNLNEQLKITPFCSR